MFCPKPTDGYPGCQPDIKVFYTPDIMSCHPFAVASSHRKRQSGYQPGGPTRIQGHSKTDLSKIGLRAGTLKNRTGWAHSSVKCGLIASKLRH